MESDSRRVRLTGQSVFSITAAKRSPGSQALVGKLMAELFFAYASIGAY